MSQQIGREQIGFATPEEYKEAEERLRRYQETLYQEANSVFERIEEQINSKGISR